MISHRANAVAVALARGLLVTAAVALLTFVCFRLGANLAMAVCLYIILIVLFSLEGSFPLSAYASLLAVFCLDYFFSRPLFSLQVGDPVDIVAIVLFLGTSGVITTLVSRERARSDELAQTVASLKEQISERLRTEAILGQAQDFARVNRVMLVGEMTSSIAHEISQPVTGIVANAGTCLRYLSAPFPALDEVRSHLEFIARDGRRAADVIDRVRSLVKRTPPRTEHLDIHETIREVIALAQRQLERDPVDLRLELADGLPAVPGDRIQLQQVILNLLVNALEAMRGIDSRHRELVIRSGVADAGEVFVEVRDSGSGFDQADRDRLFGSFYTTKPEGMGMGLAISRLIVEAHGGRLTASPNADHGATFRFSLPIAAPSSDDE